MLRIESFFQRDAIAKFGERFMRLAELCVVDGHEIENRSTIGSFAEKGLRNRDLFAKFRFIHEVLGEQQRREE